MSDSSPHEPGLSVFLPAYNDSSTIASMVIRAVQAASRLTRDYEVIVVNDGSADATGDILDELARTSPNVRVVNHPKNLGYGDALRLTIDPARMAGAIGPRTRAVLPVHLYGQAAEMPPSSASRRSTTWPSSRIAVRRIWPPLEAAPSGRSASPGHSASIRRRTSARWATGVLL